MCDVVSGFKSRLNHAVKPRRQGVHVFEVIVKM